METLPTEILREILSMSLEITKLEKIRDSINALTSVCKKWRSERAKLIKIASRMINLDIIKPIEYLSGPSGRYWRDYFQEQEKGEFKNLNSPDKFSIPSDYVYSENYLACIQGAEINLYYRTLDKPWAKYCGKALECYDLISLTETCIGVVIRCICNKKGIIHLLLPAPKNSMIELSEKNILSYRGQMISNFTRTHMLLYGKNGKILATDLKSGEEKIIMLKSYIMTCGTILYWKDEKNDPLPEGRPLAYIEDAVITNKGIYHIQTKSLIDRVSYDIYNLLSFFKKDFRYYVIRDALKMPKGI